MGSELTWESVSSFDFVSLNHERTHLVLYRSSLNHFATKRAWDLKNTKNDVFLARNRSRNFFDMGEGAIDSLDVCLSYEGYKSTFRQHWATL